MISPVPNHRKTFRSLKLYLAFSYISTQNAMADQLHCRNEIFSVTEQCISNKMRMLSHIPLICFLHLVTKRVQAYSELNEKIVACSTQEVYSVQNSVKC